MAAGGINPRHLTKTPPNCIVVARREDAEKLHRFIQQNWDIGPAENYHGQWLIKVPATYDLTWMMMKFLRETFDFSTIRVLDYENYCPACHELNINCSCNVA